MLREGKTIMRPPTDVEIESIVKEATWAQFNPQAWAPGQSGWPYYAPSINADLSRRLYGWLIIGRRHIDLGRETPEARLVMLIDQRQTRLANIQPAMNDILLLLNRATTRTVRGTIHDGATDFVGADAQFTWDGSITEYGFSIRWSRLNRFSVRWRVGDGYVFTPGNIRLTAQLTLDKFVVEFRRLAGVLENSIIREDGDAQVIAFPSFRSHIYSLATPVATEQQEPVK